MPVHLDRHHYFYYNLQTTIQYYKITYLCRRTNQSLSKMKKIFYAILATTLIFTACNDDDEIKRYTYTLKVVPSSESSSTTAESVIVSGVADYAREAMNKALELAKDASPLPITDLKTQEADEAAINHFSELFDKITTILDAAEEQINEYKKENADALSQESEYAMYSCSVSVTIIREEETGLTNSTNIKTISYVFSAHGGEVL